MSVIESFLVSLGFQTDTKGLEELKTQAEGAKVALMSIVGVATAAAAGIGLLVGKVAEGMAEMNDFAEINEVSAAAVAALGKAAEQNNSSLEAVKNSISGINKVIGEAAIGVGRGAMTFEKLGLSAKDATGKVKTADSMLEEVADKIKGLSRQEQIATLEKLGIDRSMVMMLKDGSEAFREMREEASGGMFLTDEDYARADRIDKLMKKARASMGAFTKQLAVGLFPEVERVLKGYLEWYKASRKATGETMLAAIKAIAAGVAVVWDWVVRLATAFKNFIDWLTKFKIVTYAAIAALAIFIGLQVYEFAMNARAAFAKLAIAVGQFAARMMAANGAAVLLPAIIGLIILAVAALIDEFVNFAEGNESFIGDLVKDYPQLLPIINAIAGAIKGAWSWLTSLFDQVKPALGNLMDAFIGLAQALWPVIKGIGMVAAWLIEMLLPVVIGFAIAFAKMLAWAVETAVAGFTWLIEMITKFVDYAVLVVNFFVNAWKSGVDMITGFFSGMFDKLFGWVDKFMDKVGGAIKWVGGLLGMSTGDGGTVAGAVSRAADATNGAPTAGAGSPSAFRPTGAIGVAATPSASSGGSSPVQISNTVPQIVINSPDPARAGESVKETLDRMNRDSIRNAQSAIAL